MNNTISSYVNPPKKGITPSQNDISSATIFQLDKVAFGVKFLSKFINFDSPVNQQSANMLFNHYQYVQSSLNICSLELRLINNNAYYISYGIYSNRKLKGIYSTLVEGSIFLTKSFCFSSLQLHILEAYNYMFLFVTYIEFIILLLLNFKFCHFVSILITLISFYPILFIFSKFINDSLDLIKNVFM